jgi:hypothetical protein
MKTSTLYDILSSNHNELWYIGKGSRTYTMSYSPNPQGVGELLKPWHHEQNYTKLWTKLTTKQKINKRILLDECKCYKRNRAFI